MASETEVDRMVVRLVGDGKEYSSMLKEATSATEAYTRDTNGMLRDSQGKFVSGQEKFRAELKMANGAMEKTKVVLNSMKEGVKKTAEAFKNGSRAIKDFGSSMSLRVTAPIIASAGLAVAAFGVQETAERKLRASLEANGRQVNKLFTEYTTLASEMQGLTTIGDEVSIGMFQQAEALGVTGAAAKRAVRNAIGMGAALDMNARSALRYAALLEQGEVTMLQRYLPSLRSIEDQAGKVAEAQRLLGGMFVVAEAEAQSFVGQLTQLKNSLGDLFEQFGDVISELLQPVVDWLKNVVAWFQSLDRQTKKVVAVIGLAVAAIGPLIVAFGVFVGVLGTAISGIGTIIGLFTALISPIGLVVVAVGGIIAAVIAMNTTWEGAMSAVKNFATGALGFLMNLSENLSILWTWMKDNWREILNTMLKAVLQFATNMIHNTWVMLKTAFRIWVAFNGWVAGLFEKLFSVEFLKWVVEGIKTAAKKFEEFALWAWDKLKSVFTGDPTDSIDDFFKKVDEDFTKGANNINFLETVGDIMTEEAKNFKGPFEGLQTTLEGPKFNLSLGEDAKAEAEAEAEALGEDMAKKVDMGMRKFWLTVAEVGGFQQKAVEALDQAIVEGANIVKDVFAEPIRAMVEFTTVDAVAFDSAEALSRFNEFKIQTQQHFQPQPNQPPQDPEQDKQLGILGGIKEGIEALVEQGNPLADIDFASLGL